MSLLSCASGTSIWRGYDYYKEQKVTAYDCLTDSQYMGIVRGSEGALYTTTIDLLHPRRSKCNCPHADGRRIICKHMIALFFTIYPDEAEQFYNDAIKAEEDAEEYENEVYEKVVKRIMHMKKADLQQTLLDLLLTGPEWQYDRFVRSEELW